MEKPAATPRETPETPASGPTVREDSAPNENTAPDSRPGASFPGRRRAAKVAAWLIAIVALFLFFHYPRHEDDIFRALPGRSAVAAYVNDIASEEKALLGQEAVRSAIRALGGDPDETLEDNSGTYWTLFWLTGRHSCLALVPREGECGGLGVYVAGASFTGWKARLRCAKASFTCGWNIAS